MFDAVEWLLASLALALGGAAVAVAARLIRVAWRDAGSVTQPAAARKPAGDSALALRGIAAFEAIKALAVLAAAASLFAVAAHPAWIDAALAVVSRLGATARELQAFHALDHWLASERGLLLVGATGYAALHLVEAWGLWHLRAWGEALGAASGAVYLPFEIDHLLHRPAWPTASLMMLNLAVVAYLVWRLRSRGPGGR